MTTIRLLSLPLLLVPMLLAPAACGSDERPTCDEIGELCHDSTTDEGIDCHETAEDPATTEDTCVDMKDACVAECQ